jgi:hypothetical protein
MCRLARTRGSAKNVLSAKPFGNFGKPIGGRRPAAGSIGETDSAGLSSKQVVLPAGIAGGQGMLYWRSLEPNGRKGVAGWEFKCRSYGTG